MSEPSREDDFVGEWTRPLDSQTVRELSTLQPWRTFLAAAAEWSLMLAVIAGSWLMWSVNVWLAIPCYLIAIIIVAARQHALGVLMHEGTHYRLFRNRFANELFSQLFFSWPLLMDMRNYRHFHFSHHRELNSETDLDWASRTGEDWEFPKSRRELFWLFFNDAIPLKNLFMLKYLFRYVGHGGRRRDGWDAARGVHAAAVIVALTRLQLWPVYLAYWIVPILTVLRGIHRLRIIAEHYAVDYDHPYRGVRTTLAAWWERFLFCPRGINYHTEHHLYPSVPYYRLPELQRALFACEEFAKHAHVTKGYVNVLRECITCEPRVSASPVPAEKDERDNLLVSSAHR